MCWHTWQQGPVQTFVLQGCDAFPQSSEWFVNVFPEWYQEMAQGTLQGFVFFVSE
jgi:hypothetical protein